MGFARGEGRVEHHPYETDGGGDQEDRFPSFHRVLPRFEPFVVGVQLTVEEDGADYSGQGSDRAGEPRQDGGKVGGDVLFIYRRRKRLMRSKQVGLAKLKVTRLFTRNPDIAIPENPVAAASAMTATVVFVE